MFTMKFFFVIFVIVAAVSAKSDRSAVEVLKDVYYSCLKDFSIICAKPKALQWISDVSNNEEINITEDLVIVKKDNPGEMEVSFDF